MRRSPLQGDNDLPDNRRDLDQPYGKEYAGDQHGELCHGRDAPKLRIVVPRRLLQLGDALTKLCDFVLFLVPFLAPSQLQEGRSRKVFG